MMNKKQIIIICAGGVLVVALLVALITGGFKTWTQPDWTFQATYGSDDQTTGGTGEESTENSITDTTGGIPSIGITVEDREDLGETNQQQTQSTVSKPATTPTTPTTPTTKPTTGSQDDETVQDPTDANRRLTYEEWYKLSSEEKKAYKATFNGDAQEYSKWYNEAKAAYDALHPGIPIKDGQITLP